MPAKAISSCRGLDAAAHDTDSVCKKLSVTVTVVLLVNVDLWSSFCVSFGVILKDRSKLLIFSSILTVFDCFIAVQLLSCAPNLSIGRLEFARLPHRPTYSL